jgi:hypothetical protein
MNTDKYILEHILEKPENKDIRYIIGRKKLFRIPINGKAQLNVKKSFNILY